MIKLNWEWCMMGKVDWNEIEVLENGGKVYDKVLPRYEHGKNAGRVKWQEAVGVVIPMMYQDVEYLVKVEDFDIKSRKATINIINHNFNKIDFTIRARDLLKCHLGLLVHNIYANPNVPYRQAIINSIGEEQAKKLTSNSRQEINFICPNCKKVKTIVLNQLTTRGLGCECGDGISYPEKLMINVLKSLNITYKRQISYDDGEHRYDFYLPQYGVILETHGLQHYEERQDWGGLEKQQNIDKYKRQLALQNGILNENYHEIDCRYSNLKWCRINIETVLNQYVNIDILTDKDWQEFDKKSQNSVVYELCKYYNENPNLTVKELMEIFDLSNSCVSVYLHKGNDYGWCDYDGSWYMKQIKDEKEERKQQVIQYKLQNPSATKKEMAKIFGVNSGTIGIYLKDIKQPNIQTVQKDIRKQEILKYRKNNPHLTIKELAIFFNCSQASIYNYIRENKLNPTNNKVV
jgi:transposase